MPYIDLSQTHGLRNQSQTHPRWGDLPVGPNQVAVMGRCGCLLSALSTVITHHLGEGYSGSLPWYPVWLNSLVIDVDDESIPHNSKTKKGPPEEVLSFSPVYLDAYLRLGNGQASYPLNWGYKNNADCGAPMYLDALEEIAIPTTDHDTDGNLIFSTPTGVRAEWHSGWGADVQAIVDRNLLAGNPTIVGLKEPTTGDAHAVVIAGWDPMHKMYLIYDPAAPTYMYPVAPVGGGVDKDDFIKGYAEWEQRIEGIFDVYPVYPRDLATHVVRVSDDPAPFELTVVNPDGMQAGFDPATGGQLYEDSAVNYYPQPFTTDLLGEMPSPPAEKLMSIRDPRAGNYRFLATATGSGHLTLHFDLVEGAQITNLGEVNQNIVEGQTVKIEMQSTGSGITAVNQVTTFSPDARAGNDVAGLVGEPVSFDGSRSAGIDGTIVSHSWDFGDGATASGAQASHTYTAPGVYQVTLTVTDDQGATGTDTLVTYISGTGDSTKTTERISLTDSDQEISGSSSDPSLNSDGRFVAFSSTSGSITPNDANGKTDVFLRDRQTGRTELISVGLDGGAGNDRSDHPAISADGRFVAFVSDATNLVPGDTSSQGHIFVRDRVTQTTELVSVADTGEQGNGSSRYPAISADGRFVAFDSRASNLVTDDTNAHLDVFVRDRQLNTTERVSVSSSGQQGMTNCPNYFCPPTDGSTIPSISADGRFVAFESDAAGLIPSVNTYNQVYVRDRQAGTTEVVSVNLNGTYGNNHSKHASISGDGRYVAFWSGSASMVSGTDANGWLYDIYVRDRQTATTERVNVSTGEVQASFHATDPAISPNGRYVTFYSSADNLVPDDTNHPDGAPHPAGRDVFLRDREEGTTERISVSSTGEQALPDVGAHVHGPKEPAPVIDAGGVAFASTADNLVPDDTNGAMDIFMRSAPVAEPAIVKPIANPSGPYLGWATSPENPTAIAFDGSASFDPNGVQLTAEWDFGDGSPLVTGDDLTPSHSYAAPGRYAVTLTVTNGTATSEPITTTVEVFPSVPVDRLTATPTCVDPGQSLAISGYNAGPNQGVLDTGWDLANGSLTLDPVEITLDWSDGQPLSLMPATADHLVQTTVTVPAGLAPGSYAISIPGVAATEVVVGCPPGNQMPVPDAAGPYQGMVGDPVLLDGSGSHDPDGAELTYSWDFGDGNTGEGVSPEHTYEAAGVYLATLTVSDGTMTSIPTAGTRSFALVTITADGTSPTTTATGTRADGHPYTFDTWINQPVTVTLNGTDNEGGSGVQASYYTVDGGDTQPYPADGVVLSDEGIHTLEFWSVDQAGNAEAPQSVTIKIDTTAPTCSCSVSPERLWPANHKLVDVTATVSVDDTLSGAAAPLLMSVTSNEPDEGIGDGNTSSDIQGWLVGTADTTGKLRAERSGTGDGRIYTLTYQTSDGAGNTASCTATVIVPHDQRR